MTVRDIKKEFKHKKLKTKFVQSSYEEMDKLTANLRIVKYEDFVPAKITYYCEHEITAEENTSELITAALLRFTDEIIYGTLFLEQPEAEPLIARLYLEAIKPEYASIYSELQPCKTVLLANADKRIFTSIDDTEDNIELYNEVATNIFEIFLQVLINEGLLEENIEDSTVVGTDVSMIQ